MPSFRHSSQPNHSHIHSTFTLWTVRCVLLLCVTVCCVWAPLCGVPAAMTCVCQKAVPINGVVPGDIRASDWRLAHAYQPRVLPRVAVRCRAVCRCTVCRSVPCWCTRCSAVVRGCAVCCAKGSQALLCHEHAGPSKRGGVPPNRLRVCAVATWKQ